MDLKTQRRIAAEILKVGISRVWIDSSNAEEISKAITKQDIKELIEQGYIKAKKIKGVSRGRAKKLHEQRKKGRRRGHGRRKGTENARMKDKKKWMNKVRALRKFLESSKKKGDMDSKTHRKLYLKIKGDFFRNTSHLKSYIEKLKKEQ